MKDIAIETAKRISEDSGYPEVVIFAYDPETNMQHITTYGKTAKQSLDAARAGNDLKRHLGWSEDQCQALPEWLKKGKSK